MFWPGMWSTVLMILNSLMDARYPLSTDGATSGLIFHLTLNCVKSLVKNQHFVACVSTIVPLSFATLILS